MDSKNNLKLNKQRKKHNNELISKMKKGENLKKFNSLSSWFPPRPIIKKDKALIDKLYNNNKELSQNEPAIPLKQEKINK